MVGRRVFLLAWVLFSNLGFSEGSSVEALDNVFGEDKREPVLSAEYPWSTIGRISTNCTATLVAPDIILTAAHCVIDPKTKLLNKKLSTFSLNMVAGRSLVTVPIDQVWWGTTSPEENRGQDWALCRLLVPLGNTYGWMGVVENTELRRVNMAGYSADFEKGLTATTHLGCVVHTWDNKGMLLHDCNMRPGASGGPLFHMINGAAQLVAVNVAERRNGATGSVTAPSYTPELANIAVPAAAFLPTLQTILKKP